MLEFGLFLHDAVFWCRVSYDTRIGLGRTSTPQSCNARGAGPGACFWVCCVERHNNQTRQPSIGPPARGSQTMKRHLSSVLSPRAPADCTPRVFQQNPRDRSSLLLQ